MHQVHCVGVIWEFVHRHEWDFQNHLNMSEQRWEIHNRDCNVVLLQMIKCQADLTPVLFQQDLSGLGQWKTRDAPRHCKTFDALARWERENCVCPIECNPLLTERLYRSQLAERT